MRRSWLGGAGARLDAEQAFQPHALAAQADTTGDLPVRGRGLFQTRCGAIQGHQHVLILVPGTLSQEVLDGAEVELGKPRQLQRGHRAIARLPLGDGGPRQAEPLGHCLLTQSPGLARDAQPASQLACLHGVAPLPMAAEGGIRASLQNRTKNVKRRL